MTKIYSRLISQLKLRSAFITLGFAVPAVLFSGSCGKKSTAAASQIGFSQATLSYAFSTLNVKKTGTHVFTMSNPGSQTVTSITSTITAPFIITTNTCGTTLAGGATCDVTVTYTPTAQSQSDSGTLTFASVSGTGAAQSLSMTLSGSAFHYFVYAANSTDSTVSPFSINTNSGALTSVGSAIACSAGPFQIAADPLGKFIFVSGGTGNSVSAYQVNSSTGVLTAVSGSPFTVGSTPVGVVADPTGSYLYVADFASDDITAFTINRTTGSLTAMTGSPFAAPGGNSPLDLQMDSQGRFLYVSSRAGEEFVYTINASTGSLTLLSGAPFASGLSWGWGSALDPSGNFILIASSTIAEISSMAVDVAGALSAETGSPFTSSTTGGFGIAMNSTGTFAFLANGAANTISSFSIAAGIPTKIQELAAGSSQFYLTVDPSDQYVLVPNRTTNNVSSYKIGNTGLLSHLSDATAGTAPITVKVLSVP